MKSKRFPTDLNRWDSHARSCHNLVLKNGHKLHPGGLNNP